MARATDRLSVLAFASCSFAVAWATQATCAGACEPGPLDSDCGDTTGLAVFADPCPWSLELASGDGSIQLADCPASVAAWATAFWRRLAWRQKALRTAHAYRSSPSLVAIAPKQGPPR